MKFLRTLFLHPKRRKKIEEFVKRKVLVAAALSVALLLTGCSQVNTAAKVGNKTITTKDIQTSVNNILKERSGLDLSQNNLPTGAKLNVSVLQFHLYSLLFDAIANGTKMPVTDGDIAKERASIIAQVGGEDKLNAALAGASIARADFSRYMRSVVIVAKLKQALAAAGDKSTDGSGLQNVIIAAGKQEGVEINPRYGSWNSANGTIDLAPANPAVKQLK
jgi:SurA N-terminal domain